MKSQTLPPIDAEKAMHISLGAASPLWLLYAGAGAAGAAFYWMTRWRQATNLEAVMGMMSRQAQAAVEAAEATVELAEEAAEAVADAAEPTVEATVAALMPEPVAEMAPEPDDLTVLKGVGPKLAVKLAERGITRFADVAAMSAETIADLDAELMLLGRIERDDWIGQAKQLM
ncbi:MAG TPA: helix-hairpin-helix domain-containing protein [Caulobacteraceae bacterium]